MALEQMAAFLDDAPLAELGATTSVGPEGYPMLEGSELAAEHERVSELLRHPSSRPQKGSFRVKDSPVASAMVGGDVATRTRLYLALLERAFAWEADWSERDTDVSGVFGFHGFYTDGAGLRTMRALLETGVDEQRVLLPTLRWIAARRNVWGVAPLLEALLPRLVAAMSGPEGETYRALLRVVRVQLDDGYCHQAPEWAERLDPHLGEGAWRLVPPVEAWSAHLLEHIEGGGAERRDAWLALIRHCQTASAAKPSRKWARPRCARPSCRARGS